MEELNVLAIVSSLNQISSFSSNSQMGSYLESLSSMVHFLFNHVKELELSHKLCQTASQSLGPTFFYSDLEFTAIHSLK